MVFPEKTPPLTYNYVEDTLVRQKKNRILCFVLAYWINFSRSTKEMHYFCSLLIEIFVSLHPLLYISWG